MDRPECREEERPYELWLCSFPGMGNRQMTKLAELCGSAREAYYAGTDKWGQVLREKQVEGLKRFTEGWEPQREWERLENAGIRFVTLKDRAYPGRLRQIPDAPYGLFFRGSLPEERYPAVAVVGARDCSRYGYYVAEKLGETLGRNGVIVVSGMARGIDGISQRAALDAGGVSCGVLGCGVDICYPGENRELYQRLARDGCLVSSYPPGTPALARNFPPRNRIVSGLADAVVVVEAREKSGTLITVDMALEQGREVYAVPGRITDPLSEGCNRLIRQGAVPLSDPGELLSELCGSPRQGPDEPEEGCPAWLPEKLRALYDALEVTPKTVEEIRESLPAGFAESGGKLTADLMRLCLEDLAVQVSPGCFCGKFR